jgi:hypothetical protein
VLTFFLISIIIVNKQASKITRGENKMIINAIWAPVIGIAALIIPALLVMATVKIFSK